MRGGKGKERDGDPDHGYTLVTNNEFHSKREYLKT